MANVLTAAAKAAASVIFGSGSFGSGTLGRPAAGPDVVFNSEVAQSIIQWMTAGDLYETQPHLRTVVSFVARNSAQLGRHIYAKGSDGRKRVENSPAAQLLEKPNSYQTGYDLFNMLFSELALYDFALWVPVMRDGRWQIDPIPGSWIVGHQRSDAFRVEKYKVQEPGSSEWRLIPASDAVVFRGYSPTGFKTGSSAVVSLKGTLSEQVAAMEYREQLWNRGGRVGMFMSRPADAPEWSPEAKAKFIQQWKSSWAGTGANAGSTPLLEDGMELKRVGFNAKEEQWLEAATLSLSTVAGAYHVPPAMVGVAGYNSFASVKEFRKMLYTETLGPLVAQVEETINTFLLPFIMEPAANFLELNIGEKLQGDFEEQGNVLFQAVGGPYMTAAEARKLQNLPFLEGTDVLLAPLNMGAAGNNGPAADEPIAEPPADGTAPKSNGEPHGAHIDGGGRFVKAPVEPDYGLVSDMSLEIKRVLKRQRSEVIARANLTQKADPTWWDQKKWNRELSAALLPPMTSLTAGVARDTAGAKGYDPEGYSVGETVNFLKAVADSRADLINTTTREQLEEAFRDADPDKLTDAVNHVFDVGLETRAPESALTMSTMLTAWASVEAAKQLMADKEPRKRWISSGKANSRHSGMNGQTVPISEKFSNGADWPGDPVLGAAGVANCGCGVEIIT